MIPASDVKVPHRCVACGRRRMISRRALRMIERGVRMGRCRSCNGAALPAPRPASSRRPAWLLTDEQIREWAAATWSAMSDRDRALIGCLPLDLGGVDEREAA